MKKRPPIRAILCAGDPWHYAGRWAPATVQYGPDARNCTRFHGITPTAWLLIRAAVRRSSLWPAFYRWWERMESRQQRIALDHRNKARSIKP